MWATSLASSLNGKVATLCTTEAQVKNLIDIPEELAFDSNCAFKASSSGSKKVTFTDGNSTNPPVWKVEDK